MKELSIEQKAKRYNEAIKEAVIAHKDEDKHLKATLERIFPELKESEDERIRKELIDIVAKSPITFAFEDKNKVLSWLERQGEHANFINKIQIGDKVTRNEDGVLVNLSQLNRVAKPTDKVESKFKVGDWIVHNDNGCICQITSIREDDYCLWPLDSDIEGYLEITDIDNKYHLWTIQDAKDSDVLATEPIEGYPSPFVAIYKKQNEEDFNSYCFIGFDGKFYKGENGHSTEEVHPATKEQRDQLEKAMADAGYTFDFEKKKLKKIEQTPNDEIGNYDHGKVLDALMSAKKTPEPAWSEEDKDILFRTIDNLKFLKDTISTDPKYYVNIIDIEREITWLKSLRPQNTWKPSDEQMIALQEAMNIVGILTLTGSKINSLYQDLKKLK